jgi:hypothetical protein
MRKEDIQIDVGYFKLYIDQTEDKELMDMLPNGGLQSYVDHYDDLESLGDYVYAPGKWTIRQLIEHLIDTERIFQARALRIARGDKTPLPGYDQDLFVENSHSSDISLKKLINDYKNLRKSTVDLFANFNENDLTQVGMSSGNQITPLAIGFILVGHPIHHFKVIQERYMR